MKNPIYLAWAAITLGTLSVSNLRGWRILPAFAAGGAASAYSSSSSGSSFFSGWRSFGSGGGSFHK
jgi:hypothetical protein